MPREGHTDNSSIVPVPVRKGGLISLPSDDGFGYSRKPAPDDGIYFEVPGGGYFLGVNELEEALQALYDDISEDVLGSPEAAAAHEAAEAPTDNG